MSDKVFVDGVIFKLPRDNAPEFVKGSISIKMKDLIAFAKEHHKDGWLNVDLLVGRSGKPYTALNTWEPKKEEAKVPAVEEFEDSIPF